ncbi:MAG: hypothetical protein QOF76_246 [Solirubrobacteraceae bacterium]|nr:hypothetical protein [Solirubrobacteraceae bacterium]
MTGLGRHDFSATELALQLAADRDGTPYLLYRDGEQALHLLVLQGPVINVGREPGLELVIDWDGEVSRVHARLEGAGRQWSVLDDGLSRNGTFVKGERLKGRKRLSHGDRLRFGRTEAVFRDPAALPPDTLPAIEWQPIALTPMQQQVLEALCRPVLDGEPVAASNKDIAADLHLSVEAVRTHLKALFARLEIPDLAQNRKRAELVRRAIESGAVGP